MITKILVVYTMLLLAVLIHELGHRPKRIVWKKWKGIPLPMASAMEASSQYGGLAASAACFLTVHYLGLPYPLNLLGAICWLHFVLYTFFGSFNHEPKVPRALWKYWVFDDIPNKLWYVFVPISIITFIMFKDYFIPILTSLGG